MPRPSTKSSKYSKGVLAEESMSHRHVIAFKSHKRITERLDGSLDSACFWSDPEVTHGWIAMEIWGVACP